MIVSRLGILHSGGRRCGVAARLGASEQARESSLGISFVVAPNLATRTLQPTHRVESEIILRSSYWPRGSSRHLARTEGGRVGGGALGRCSDRPLVSSSPIAHMASIG